MSADPPEHMSEPEARAELAGVADQTAKQAGEPVHVPAETYRTLFAQSLDGILLFTADGAIIDSNTAAREMFGMTEDELRAARRGDLFIMGPAYADLAAERERTGRIAGEATFIRKDGTQFPVDYTSILPGGAGGHGYGLVTFRDISTRKAMQTSLRESEERFRRALSETKAGYFLIDREGRFVEVNEAWLRIHGYDSADEVIGRHFSLTQVEADLTASQCIVETMLAGGSVPDGDFSHRRRDGSVGYHTFTISPVIERGEVVGLEGFLIDASESRRAEQALRESEARQREVLEHGGMGVAYWDLDGRLLFLNQKAAENLGGASPDDFMGRLFPDLFGEEAGKAYLARIHAAASSESPIVFEDCVDLPIGRRWLSSIHTRSLDSAGNVVGVHVYASDITAIKEVEGALRQKERDLLEAQELAHIGNYSLDLRTQQLTWSDGMFRIWGLDPKRGAPRDSIRTMMLPEDYERVSRAVAEAMEHGTPYELELRIRRSDGRERTVVTTGMTELDATGKVVILKGTHQDITERRQAEEEYRTLFREMLDGFALHEIICDAGGSPVDYRFLAVNPAFERMTGLRAEDIVGRTVLDVLPGTERYWIESYGDVALTGRPAFFESYHAQLDKHFSVTAFQPAPGQFACFFADITERKRAGEALRESEAKIRGILDNIRVGVTLISPQMEILEMNPLMREWFPHIDPGQAPICYRVINKPPGETVCDECPTEATLHDGRVHEMTRETRVSGSPRKFRIVSSPIFDASGDVSAAIEMVEDVTERIALELQLQQSQKMESVGRLAGGVAHDFNNMLGVILGHIEMALAQTSAGEALHASLREVQKAAERSAELTHQLLAFARKQTIAPRVVDVNETITGMLKMLERLIGEDILLDWQPGEDLWPVRIDPSQVGQILTNLCVNARDAIAGVGRVTIATRNRTVDPTYRLAHAGLAPGEYVQLAVSDDGCGMDQETMAKLFEPFFTTKGVGKGTGLGLATVYGIVRQNGGFVEAESELDGGSTLTVYLPRHGAAVETLESEAEPAPPTRGQETILLVEDEPALLDLATMMLQRQGYTVVAASSPGEALRLAREHPGEIHLLITDVIMPEMNGRDLAKNLLSLYPGVKRLFMSGYTSDVIAHQGVLEEGVHFLQKPFASKDLGNKVRAVLDGEE
jgi:two-component system, cell cycle sensor histidine kinase and response regulator CckA